MRIVLKHFLQPLRLCYRVDRHTCSSFRDRSLISPRDHYRPSPDCTCPCPPCLHPCPYHHTYLHHHTFHLLRHTYHHCLQTFHHLHSHRHSLTDHSLTVHNYYLKLRMEDHLIHQFTLCHQLILCQSFLLQVSLYLLTYSMMSHLSEYFIHSLYLNLTYFQKFVY